MSKKPIFMMVTDLHIKDQKDFEVLDSLIDQIIEKCKTHKINHLLLLGDVFTYRNSQPLSALLLFQNFIKKLKKNGIMLVAIAGNHDKTDQDSLESYLSVYTGHDNYSLIKKPEVVLEFENMIFSMMPYFPEDGDYVTYLANHLKELIKDYDVPNTRFFLLTHIAVKDARMNDGKVVKSGVSSNVFDFFEEVFVGHFHNKQSARNITYTGSWRAKNFGEDNDKGVTIMYSDGSSEFEKLKFPKFKSFEFHLPEELTSVVTTFAEIRSKLNGNNIRFILHGTENDFAKAPMKMLKKAGVKIKKVDIETAKNMEAVEINPVTRIEKDDVMGHLKDFGVDFGIQENDLSVFIKYFGEATLTETIRR